MAGFRSGNGAVWLDLMSTLSGRYEGERVDAIATPARLRAWLRANDLEPRSAVTPEDVVYAGELRESLHRLAVTAIRGDAPAASDVRRLNTALKHDGGLQVSRTSDGIRPGRPASVGDALARLARQAAVDLAGQGHGALRACGDDTCAGIFLDTTGRRRWCTDLRCGNRVRVRAHRGRVGS
jgi:predicted RNA-binding Zn ribbon-like protein